jgi:hypothetical protein
MSYAGVGKPHTLGVIEGDGAVLVLEDSSRWQIYEGFAFRSGGWAAAEMINVKQGKNPEYPYTLVNIHRNEQVEARYLQGGDE